MWFIEDIFVRFFYHAHVKCNTNATPQNVTCGAASHECHEIPQGDKRRWKTRAYHQLCRNGSKESWSMREYCNQSLWDGRHFNWSSMAARIQFNDFEIFLCYCWYFFFFLQHTVLENCFGAWQLIIAGVFECTVAFEFCSHARGIHSKENDCSNILCAVINIFANLFSIYFPRTMP